ncbi:MAG: pseudouridine-5'-phosphate glycosidase, partial [Nitriliruptorales bacterium]|nr:pseudouridine-5'-phosphate glycosidase [Nitriliruptorales bacterium]
PAAHALPLEDLETAVAAAHRAARGADVRGADLTPFVLERLADQLGPAAIDANVALAANNARVAAQVAVALTRA